MVVLMDCLRMCVVVHQITQKVDVNIEAMTGRAEKKVQSELQPFFYRQCCIHCP
jgi:20S proteasome alpha/beta subunit